MTSNFPKAFKFDVKALDRPDGEWAVALEIEAYGATEPFRAALTAEQAVTLALVLVLKASGTEQPPVAH